MGWHPLDAENLRGGQMEDATAYQTSHAGHVDLSNPFDHSAAESDYHVDAYSKLPRAMLFLQDHPNRLGFLCKKEYLTADIETSKRMD